MLKNVNRYTRAGRFGKQITCPKCNHTETLSTVRALYTMGQLPIRDVQCSGRVMNTASSHEFEYDY